MERYAIPGLMTPSAPVKARLRVELLDDGSVHLPLDFIAKADGPIVVHLCRPAWDDPLPCVAWSDRTGRYIITEKDGLHLRVPRWILPLKEGSFEFWIWQGGRAWHIPFAGKALWDPVLTLTSIPTPAPYDGPAYVEGEAAVATTGDEQIAVTFPAAFSIRPTHRPLISPLSDMPGWVLPDSVSATGFTIQLAGPGTAGTTAFAYRQSL